ncbi:MAG TPA: amidohydrolase family protein [Solirubrobacteraceae bacterium]
MTDLRGAIDCDVHCAPASMAALVPYMDDYWRDYVENAGMYLSPTLTGTYPEAVSPPPPADVDALREQVLDPWGLRAAVLTCVSAFDTSRNPYYETALCKAINDWLRAEWLERDERLRASMVVPTLDPDAAIAEIERVGGHPGFVAVLLPVRSDARWGGRRFHPLHEAIAGHDLVLALHAWGRIGTAPTTSGSTHTYFEDYLANSQSIAQGQVMSLVAEGVFERVPSLRVALLECGFSWVPPMLWRFDKDWKAVWREVPWLKAKPSEYVQRHFHATTAPAQLPADRDQAAQLAEMLGAGEFLLFASDHPHRHGDGNLETLLEVLGDTGRDAVMHGNAAALYGLAA